jgi:hypothetical protein
VEFRRREPFVRTNRNQQATRCSNLSLIVTWVLHDKGGKGDEPVSRAHATEEGEGEPRESDADQPELPVVPVQSDRVSATHWLWLSRSSRVWPSHVVDESEASDLVDRGETSLWYGRGDSCTWQGRGRPLTLVGQVVTLNSGRAGGDR